MKVYLSPSKQSHNMYAGQGVSEQTMCNRYAQACKAALEAAGHQVVLNIAASLTARIAEANRWGADLYVPIHTNAGGGKGVEVLVSGNGRADAYAASICAELAAVIPSRTNRGLKPTAKGRPGAGEIYGANAPVAYVEAEFHDNPDYAAWLVANPSVVGEAIARGIVAVAGGSVPDAMDGGSVTPPPSAGLVVDGLWGPATTRRLQQLLGTPVDGVVSRQNAAWRSPNPGLTGGWQWLASGYQAGSPMVRALQGRVGAGVDGLVGPDTFTQLQRYLGTPADGVVSRPSPMVRALQARLNAGGL